MTERVVLWANYAILYSFFALLLVVPLTFSGSTYELFEFNKMWLTYGLTIIIGCAWLVKMVFRGKVTIQRSPLDLPLLLFLLSQGLSTYFSMEPHVSVWGYYSRFNGGLLSIISYVLLYFTLVSNYADLEILVKNVLRKLILVGLAGGAIVALWGLPSHFGYDPNCLVLVGSFDVSCWTEAFMPQIRIFSTFGQPNWLASYLGILLPVSIAFVLERSKNYELRIKDLSPKGLLTTCYLLLATVFYLDLIFAKSQSGFMGAIVGVAFLVYFLIRHYTLRATPYVLRAIVFVFLLIAFFIGQPIHALDRFTLPELQKHIFKQIPSTAPPETTTFAGEFGGTDSGTIRKIVWLGALDIWIHNPIIGTGVETFAYSYYKYRPVAHNLTSEWDYLYNKAHNEYLNYLATTGAFGFLTYLGIIGVFLFLSLKQLSNRTIEQLRILPAGLVAGYLSILVSNFFGFSTVVINIYFFLIPAIVLLLLGLIDPAKTYEFNLKLHRILQWIGVTFIILASLFLILSLVRYWVADTHFAAGYNLDRAGEYQKAYPELFQALSIRPSEPTFLDEYSYNTAILAVALSQDNQATASAMLKQKAESTSDYIVATHPNNIVSWKTRVRAMYALSQIDKSYLPKALDAVQRASDLAPTDAKILYNEGVLYGQNNMTAQAIQTLEKTVQMKPNYLDAWYALGLYYRESAVDAKQKVTDEAMQKKAVQAMEFIVKNFPKDQTDKAVETLKTWGN